MDEETEIPNSEVTDMRSQLLNAEKGYEAVFLIPKLVFPVPCAERTARKVRCAQGPQRSSVLS